MALGIRNIHPYRLWKLFTLLTGLVTAVTTLGLCLGIYFGELGFVNQHLQQVVRSHFPAIASGLTLTATLLGGLLCFRLLNPIQGLSDIQHKLEQLTITDELTGLYNRRHFFTRLDEELDRARRYGSNLSLIMLDIDHIRRVNETLGDTAGDMALTEVARLLEANIRTSDFIARYGGEEFAILIPAVSVEDATRAAEKLRIVVEVNDLAMEGPELKVTISAGVADVDSVRDTEGSLKDVLIRAADKALGRAKSEGRNKVVRHQDS